MAGTSELDHERACDEAAAWLIRLQEEPNDGTLRRQFEAWRTASPAHQAAWAEIAQAFDLIGQAMPEGNDSVRALPARTRPRRRLVWAAVAAAAMAACLVLVFLPGLMLQLEADYATATRERRDVRLADGSLVELAPQSAINVVLTADRREVRLLAGRAFFEVAPDAARPFQVSAEDVRVTVLGTAFDMRLGHEAASIAVSHGVVQVDHVGFSPPLSQELKAGDWARVSWTGQVAVGSGMANAIGAWREGVLVAHDRPVAEIVDELRPYFSGVILVANEAVGRRRVTGVYRLGDPVEALRAVARAHADIAVTRVLPWLLVVSGG